MRWADREFQDASFGDDRLRQRAIRVCERLAEHPGESIPVACRGRAEVEAAYRFFSNDKVTAARVLGPHHEASLRRLAGHPVGNCSPPPSVALVSQRSREAALSVADFG